MKKEIRIALGVLQFICITCFLFYVLMVLGSSHEIPIQTYLKMGAIGLLLGILFLGISFIKTKK